MINVNLDDLKGVKKEEYISNLVGLTLEDYRSLKKIISNGIPELIETVRKKIISPTIGEKIAELPKKKTTS